MKFKYIHPKDEIIEIISRIYQNGMTTTSGGNLSLIDSEGALWITPKGIDKGTLTPLDIVKVLPNGQVEGIHPPSSELPFHKAIYKARPDIRAVVHAHPPALVSFAITRRIPDTRIMPKASEICGHVGYAKYELPGSDKLGEVIAEIFTQNHDTVLMENHGIVTVGNSLMHAFQRLETLDFCAQLTLNANILGGGRVLSQSELLLTRAEIPLDEFEVEEHGSNEKEIRKTMISFIRRSYSQRLVTSMEGTFSARLADDAFIITPWGVDRKYLSEEDLVLIKGNKRETGKKPSRSAGLHSAIYKKNPGINSIMIAHPPNIMAFGISSAEFDSKTIPESYLVLKDVPKAPFGVQFTKQGDDSSKIIDYITEKTPVVICQNDCIIVTGTSLLQSFDRLEVAEFSAKSILLSKALGPLVPIGSQEITELEKAFDM